jgi:putative glutamine amidotransferase
MTDSGGHAAGRPLVIVTGPHKTLRFGWWATRLMLWVCGLRACYVTPTSPRYPEGVAGVVIGGGDDVQPQHYGLTGDAGARYDPERDELELEIFRIAFANQVPVLGICRGAQLMNIARGGNLHQDLRPLRKRTPNRNTIFKIKDAFIEPGTKLAAIVGRNELRVNSLHNQAIDDIGEPFRLAAMDLDGFVQAIEHAQHPFMIGVQWHPEYLPYASHQRKLFAAFSRAVKNSRNIMANDRLES